MDVLNAHLPRLLDLAGNFNIDLSGVLAGYAQRLQNEVPGKENFSFAEAALLLQQCTEIYGRKVDYVYNLVVELCDNMNARMYGPLGDSQQETVAIIKKTRRRKAAVQISTEDFKLHVFSFDKPKIFKKFKKNQNHCREAMCVRLAPVNLRTSHEFHIYENDQYASIGTKDQFRLNWSLEQNCRLEEYINDEGSGSVWDVMDVRVSSMPTPEYSDDGVPEAPEAISDTTTVQEPEPDIDVNILLSCEAAGREADQVLSSTLNSTDLLPVVEKHLNTSKVPFKLPYELTRKGLKEGKKEKNITMFLFSKLLKRELKMKGILPLFSKERNGDQKLLAKHVQFLMKRFNLEKKGGTFNSKSLTEQQEDFYGFEEVVLHEVPEVLNSSYENESSVDTVDINDSDAVRDICEYDNFDVPIASEDDNFDVPIASEDVVQTDCNTKRKSTVNVEGMANWKHFIQEKLSQEDEGRKFDVHEYGSDILDSFQNAGQTLSFREIVKGKNARDISRYFVSSLMLANTTNVSLDHNGPNTLKVTLNHRERHHEMENFLVPPAAGGLPPSAGQSKRKANSESGSDDETPQRRCMKQIPGKGPWKNKSKKGRDK